MKSGREPILKLLRFKDTVKHLGPQQTLGRIGFMLRRKFCKTTFGQGLLDFSEHWLNTHPCSETINFCFLNKSETSSCRHILWCSSDRTKDNRQEKLWIYNLNYFKWLEDKKISLEAKKTAIFSWIINNSESSKESWEPFPLSERLMNWVQWIDTNSEKLTEDELRALIAALQTQTDRLILDLEYHHRANHLLINICAYIISEAFLLKHGKGSINELNNMGGKLTKQLKIQFLPDGAHFELCPSYHLEMMKLLDQVYNAASSIAEASDLQNTCNQISVLKPKMRSWLSSFVHPDGTLAQFGDTGFVKIKVNEFPAPEGAFIYEDSGYFVYRKGPVYFIMKLSGPAPDFQPGHSHCDLLSYELSLHGKKIIYDTGVASYQNRKLRAECRCSAAHNIPMVEHIEQSDMYDLFKVGKRAALLSAKFNERDAVLSVHITDQFGQEFTRTVSFENNEISINDSLEIRRLTGTFISVLHCPVKNCNLSEKNKELNIKDPDLEVNISSDVKRLHAEETNIFPDFGLCSPAYKVVLSSGEESEITYAIRWKKI